MEAWIAQLEMEWDEESIVQMCSVNNDGENEGVIFGEQLAAVLGDDFPYTTSSNTSSPTSLDQFDYLTDFPTLIPQQQQTHSPLTDTVTTATTATTTTNNNNNNEQVRQEEEEEEEDDDEAAAAARRRPKRKRQANQVQDHIMAERKRRELLTQRFIALSALVPGLKKTDKTSVMGEAIKYLSELKEKVKKLEELAAKHSVESVVMMVKKTQVVVDNEQDSSSTSFNNYGNNNNRKESLPEIEVKRSDKTLLFRIYCERQQGILPKLLSELEKHSLAIVNTSIIPFGALALDITILAHMEIGFHNNVKEIITSLHSTIRLSH